VTGSTGGDTSDTMQMPTSGPSATDSGTGTAGTAFGTETTDAETTDAETTDTDSSGSPPVVEPAALEVDGTGNGVLEPDETAMLQPSWTETGSGAGRVAGSLIELTGPGGGAYVLDDDAAQYVFAGGDTVSCADAPADCYAVQVSAATRPEQHWDAQAAESLDASAEHTWTLHIGNSFVDVAPTSRYYTAIETLLHHGITGGCANPTGGFCPDGTMSRATSAVFIANAMVGPGNAVPTAGNVPGVGSYDCSGGGSSLFSDVAPTSLFCAHIHYLLASGVSAGCAENPLAYCPSNDVTRAQLAIFVSAAITRGAVPSDYADPDTGREYDCDDANPLVNFDDVGAGHFACRHVHYLWARGADVECTSPTMFCPATISTRAHTAQFVADGFGLELYAP
jgi:hypothetical protein